MARVVSALEIKSKDIKMDKQPFARGGFGKVYKATRRKDAVVIKVISADSKEEKEEIIREAELILFV